MKCTIQEHSTERLKLHAQTEETKRRGPRKDPAIRQQTKIRAQL